MMNRPPTEFTLVNAEILRSFVSSVFEKAGAPAEKADFLANCLVDNDLRGVFSHGTRQVIAYVTHFRNGHLTPNPDVKVINESPTTLVLDGDGGLGYYASYQLTKMLVPKAKEMGIAAGITRNHGHFGADRRGEGGAPDRVSGAGGRRMDGIVGGHANPFR